MARLFADENLPLPVVEALRRRGHDVVTLQEEGYGGQALTDEIVLQLATKDNRALLTVNRRHFIRLHNAEVGHAGIIVCTFDADFERQVERVDAAIERQKQGGNGWLPSLPML